MPHEPENAAAIEEGGLLALTGQGDREAFRLLYARYSAPLFSLAVRIVGNTGEAEELMQDAFVKIWKNAASFDSRKSRPFTWAVTIMRRTCIDHLRKRRRKSRCHLRPFLALPAQEGRRAPVPGNSVRRKKRLN